MNRSQVVAGWAALALGAAGCGGPAGVSLSGAVMYDGQPVENGTLALIPADGKGAAVGGSITRGRYKVDKVPPGRYTALISAASSTLPGVGGASDLKARGTPGPATIPATAPGNGQMIDIGTADSTLDFVILNPNAKK